MRPLLLPLVCALALPASALAADTTMLVLDASGSMWGKVDGRTKVEIARDTIAGVVRDWPEKNALGLVAYGHRRRGDCSDIETLLAPGPLDAAQFTATVNGLGAVGMTPLSAAVQHAAEALKSTEHKATVILVSDGEETCNLDPCAVGTALEKNGIDFTAHVIGFDVSDPAHQAQLRCLATNTGGRYFNARDAKELTGALQGALQASQPDAPPPAQATLTAPAGMAVTQIVSVDWTGPSDPGDYIAFARADQPDGDYLRYSPMLETGAGKGKASLETPAEPGAYELRYVNPRRNNATLARVPVDVGDAEARIEAPERVPAGTPVRVVVHGPVGERHWFGFAPKGSAAGAYLQYARPTAATSEAMLMPPGEPGEYELRYVLNEHERVLASRPITVTEAQIRVSGPANVMAGDRYVFEAEGPAEGGHWIGFAPVGSDAGTYRDYVRPQGASTRATLTAPTEPGAYELRYVLNESETVAASQAVTVTPAQASLQAPASVAPAQTLRIAFSGPRGNGWIGFVQPGTLDYLGYANIPSEGEAVVEVQTPDAAGSYELVYVSGDIPVLRQPIEVR